MLARSGRPGLISRKAAAAFTPASLSPTLWVEMDSTGTLRGDPSGNSYNGALNNESAIAAAMAGGDAERCSAWDGIAPADALDFAQTTAANQPAWLTAAESAFDTPALDFIGSYRLTHAAAAFGIASGGWVCAVFYPDSVTNGGFIFCGRTGANDRVMMRVNASEVQAEIYNGSFTGSKSGAASVATKYIGYYSWNGSAEDLWLNGAQQAGTNGIGTSPTENIVSIGSRTTAGANQFDGQIAVVLGKSSGGPLSAGNRSSLFSYLAAKYGVTLS